MWKFLEKQWCAKYSSKFISNQQKMKITMNVFTRYKSGSEPEVGLLTRTVTLAVRNRGFILTGYMLIEFEDITLESLCTFFVCFDQNSLR